MDSLCVLEGAGNVGLRGGNSSENGGSLVALFHRYCILFSFTLSCYVAEHVFRVIQVLRNTFWR